MKGSYPLTRVKLHRVLLEFLSHPEVHLEYRHLTENRGRVTWDPIFPPTNMHIRIDANDDPLKHVSTVVHELTHVLFRPMFAGFMDDDLEEKMILGLEASLYSDIEKSPKRLAQWNKLIERKLHESSEAQHEATG